MGQYSCFLSRFKRYVWSAYAKYQIKTTTVSQTRGHERENFYVVRALSPPLFVNKEPHVALLPWALGGGERGQGSGLRLCDQGQRTVLGPQGAGQSHQQSDKYESCSSPPHTLQPLPCGW